VNFKYGIELKNAFDSELFIYLFHSSTSIEITVKSTDIFYVLSCRSRC